MIALGIALAVLLLATIAAAAGAAPSPRNAPKLIVVNGDGFSDFYTERYNSPQALCDSILRYRDSHVAILEWCVISGSRANYPSRVPETIGNGMTEFPRRGDKAASALRHRFAVTPGTGSAMRPASFARRISATLARLKAFRPSA